MNANAGGSRFESIANMVSTYVADESTSFAERARVISRLTMQSVDPIKSHGSDSWSTALDIPSLLSDEEKIWELWIKQGRASDEERRSAVEQARRDCDDLKRALWDEVRVALGKVRGRYTASLEGRPDAMAL